MKENPKYKASTNEVFYKGEVIGTMIFKDNICWSDVDFYKYGIIGSKLELLDETK